jgi:serine/threonine protein kinase
MARSPYCPRCLTTFPADGNVCPNLGCRSPRPPGGWPTLLGPGDILDRRYRIERVLDIGGAGATYLAIELDEHLRPAPDPACPKLAIKLLYDQRDQGSFLRRLSNEAQILQEIAHEHIVMGAGFVQRRGQAPYLITRYEPGGNLADHVARCGPLPPAVAGAILSQVLEALQVAHQQGVVHRDLKPQNVLLESIVPADTVPRVRVADFGIAKFAHGAALGSTAQGFLGTPEFAAPEQFIGASATAATDVFAAGALLHFLVTGRPWITFSRREDARQCYDQMVPALPPRLSDRFPGEDRDRIHALFGLTMAVEPEARIGVWPLLAELQNLVGRSAAEPTSPPAVMRSVLPPRPSGDARPEVPPAPMPKAKGGPQDFQFDLAPPPPPRGDLSLDDLLAPKSKRALPAELEDAGVGVRSFNPATPTIHTDVVAVHPEPLQTLDLEGVLLGKSRPEPPGEQPFDPELGRWTPHDPWHLPESLPSAAHDLLVLLGEVAIEDREVVARRIADLPPAQLALAFRSHRPGGNAAVGRGIALAILALGRAELVGTARSLLTDADPTVRMCACEALGEHGRGAVLTALQRLLVDPEPGVRVAAAIAVARCARLNNREDLGRSWLGRLGADADATVRRAAAAALGWLSDPRGRPT